MDFESKFFWDNGAAPLELKFFDPGVFGERACIARKMKTGWSPVFYLSRAKGIKVSEVQELMEVLNGRLSC